VTNHKLEKSMSKPQDKTNLILAAIAVLILIVVFLFLFVRPNTNNTQDSQEPEQAPGITQSEITQDSETQLIIGNADAEFAFIKYNDYKCSQCVLFYQNILPDIQEKLLEQGRAKLIVKNIPFMAVDSQTAAEGAYCALDQNLFAQYHSYVNSFVAESIEKDGYEAIDQDILNGDTLSEAIAKNGGDKDEFISCLQTNRFADLVTRDLKESERDQIRGTPTFIIGEQKITGAQSSRTLITVIESYIN
jgi:protein-disulfide isomerase